MAISLPRRSPVIDRCDPTPTSGVKPCPSRPRYRPSLCALRSRSVALPALIWRIAGDTNLRAKLKLANVAVLDLCAWFRSRVPCAELCRAPSRARTYILLTRPGFAASAKAPLLINSCEVDTQFPAEKQAKADAVLGDGKFAPGYLRTYFDGCTHGFSVRGDMVRPRPNTMISRNEY